MPIRKSSVEVLAVRGELDEAGRFQPGRCASTFFVRQWPAGEGTGYAIELLDRSDRPIHRERAGVEPVQTCDVLEHRRWRVTAYIGLRDDAVTVQLRHDDLVLWRRVIPERAQVDVRLEGPRVSRRAPATLRVKHSEPGEGAFLKVIYQWRQRGFQVLDVLAPKERIQVRTAELPGGRACRFVVIYSNGLRAAAAATRNFPLDPIGPSLTIVRPQPGTVLTLGQPLSLEGQVVDPEGSGGAAARERLSWWVDGELVGRGPVAGVQRPGEGRHRVTLRYEGGDGAEVSTSVYVRAGRVPPADEWPPFDDWGAGR